MEGGFFFELVARDSYRGDGVANAAIRLNTQSFAVAAAGAKPL
ncbi:hypothetical protein [Undibacter mobilis]|nr:hypothetical protein [Undibacter mobilis]